MLYLIISIATLLTGCNKIGDEDPKITSGKNIRDAKRPIGASAREILSSSLFESIEVELQYMKGFEPTPELVDNIKLFLEELINKPGGIKVFLSSIEPLKKATYTLQDIREIEDTHRNAYNAGKKLGVYILFLDGYSSEDNNNSTTFALVHRNSSVAMFAKRIRERSDRIGHPPRSLLENTVARHELGHLMGLVNVGSGMQHTHEDPNHAGHCDSRDCLMFWAVESGSIFNLVQEGRIPTLDVNCRKDLKANGGI
ncbi:hypothetical protein [Anditalea andensis]|nr:hypothetical protein [Anditalea andensis]